MNQKKRAAAVQFDRHRKQKRLLAWLIGLLLLASTWIVVLLWMESLGPDSVKERFAEHLRKTSASWENINWIECDTKKGNYELTVGFMSDVFRLKVNLMDDPSTVISIHDQSVDNPSYATMKLENDKLNFESETKLEKNRDLRLRTRCAVITEAILYAIGKPVGADHFRPREL